jgi:membrane protein DedA with SNARE-associated domain
MHAWLDWLSALPTVWLYAAITLAAFAENVFPPLPADTVVALGAFVAARGHGSMIGAWSATMCGNLAGAMCMFLLGRRVGISFLTSRFPTVFPAATASSVAERFQKGSVVAIAVSRFLPAVRALVPPVAGAMGVGAVRAATAMTVASGVWYGVVCWLAFRAGENADALLARIAAQQRIVGGIAVAVLAIVLAIWYARRSTRRRSHPHTGERP